MKKNVMMRVASALLVAVLLTTCAISGTFAKYVTQAEASDVARVAKWGVELQVVGNLYGDTYKNAQVLNNDATLTVQASDATSSTEGAKDVVAPGTENEDGFTISLKGQPEVDGKITTTITTQNIFLAAGTYGVMVPVASTVVTKENFTEFGDLYTLNGTTYTEATAWAEDTTYYTLEDEVTTAAYYPVVYTLTGHTATAGTNYNEDSLAAVVTAVKAKFNLGEASVTNAIYTYEGTTTFDSNTDLATTLLVDDLKLTWAWAFDSTPADGSDVSTQDKADTILGMLKNTQPNSAVVKKSGDTYTSALTEYTDYCLDTQFSIDITVEQVD